jgi:NADPH:quinone reductase-like Zn-dependent oxidoreductase
MKAVVQTRYGSLGNLEIREVGMPSVGDDEVLVRVHAASVHPDVLHVVTGLPYVVRLMAGWSRPKNPIPGTDMAGIVEAVGKGVTRFRPGDSVFGEIVVTNLWTNGGAFAEFVSVRQDLLALKPDNITFEQAASIPTSGYIALMNLRGGHLIPPGSKASFRASSG